MTIEELLPERTEVGDIENLAMAEQRGFYLYRETAVLIGIAAHTHFGVEEKYPLNRDQAILSGLLNRAAKLMKVVTMLASEGDNAETIAALNRCIMESVVSLEFLISSNDERYYNEFVERSLGAERELYDEILKNIALRNGEVLPIEERMINSINNVTRASGKTIESIDIKQGQWGGSMRARLKALGKEDQYLTIQRIGSHAIHGTWVDLYLNHLFEDGESGRYRIRSGKEWDSRLLTPGAYLILDFVGSYLSIAFHGIAEIESLLKAMADLSNRLVIFEARHEELFQ